MKLAVLVGIGIAALFVRDAHAGQATCSNPGLPVGATASGDLLPGRITVGLTTGLLLLDGREEVLENQGRVRYDSRLTFVETRLAVEYAITSQIAVAASLPYRVADVGVDYFDPATGTPLAMGSSTHIRNETLSGWGDPQLTVHVAKEIAGWRFHGRIGATLPLADTVDNPHTLGQIGQEHQHIQLGSGTVVPYAAVEAQRTFGPVTGAAFLVSYRSLYENDKTYRPGSRTSGGLTGSTSVVQALTVGASAEVHGETAEKWAGLVYEDEGNAGRVDALLGVSLAYRPASWLAVVADAKVPVWSHIKGTQLDYGPVFGLGVVGTIETRPPPSYAGADVAVVGERGTAAPLVPVPGKITVFDLWAIWCPPCRELDEGLAALARRYPDRIAVRKLDVVDPDSAAWAAYLEPGGFDLPYVRVVDENGAVVIDKSASPAELLRAIEALLR